MELRCARCGRSYYSDVDKIGYSILCTTPGCQGVIPVQMPLSGSAKPLSVLPKPLNASRPKRFNSLLLLGTLGLGALIGYGLQRPHPAPVIKPYAISQPETSTIMPGKPLYRVVAGHPSQAPLEPLAAGEIGVTPRIKPETVRVKAASILAAVPQKQSFPAYPMPARAEVEAKSAPPQLSVPSLPTGTDIVTVNGNDGLGWLTIINGTAQDAVVKMLPLLDNGETTAAYRGVYIRSGDSWTIKGVAVGNYKIVFSLGFNWFQDQQSFQQDVSYSQFEKPLLFQETESPIETSTERGTKRQFNKATITLNPVVNGTARTTTCDKSVFDAVN